jgi:hypothetical protein
MKRNHMIPLLIVGFSLALVLFNTPRSQAQKSRRPVGSAAVVLHSPTHAGAVHRNREDQDNPCAERQGRRHEDGEGDDSDPRIRRGFEIAPVPLNLDDKNCALVGLGSYLVNMGGCNDCHTGGGPPNFNFAAGGNPYFGQPKQTDPTTYLSGGTNFGLVGAPPSPNIISRNLTPSTKTGLPEGGRTFEQFLTILRTGKDFDHLHPNCSDTITTNCFPADPLNPVDGDLLQIMPWPNYQEMTDHEIRAMYEYLRAIPCIQGIYPGEPADRCQ